MAKLLSIFDEDCLHSLAVRMGVLVRQRNLKVLDLIRIWVFSNSYCSLSVLVDHLSQYGVFIRKQSLHARFNSKASVFLSHLAGLLLKFRLTEHMEMKWTNQFGRVMLMDSTVASLNPRCRDKFPGVGGNASESAFKVQYSFDLLNGNIEELILFPGRKTDSGYEITPIQKKDLWLFDMGYVNAVNLQAIIHQEAWFIGRFKYKTTVYFQKGESFQQIDLHREIEKMETGQIWDKTVLLTKEHKIPMRLILQKLPQKVAAENRRKIKRYKTRRMRNVSKERLAFCDVSAYITNLSPDQLPPSKVRDVYRLRWQVELVFKVWKSTFNLDKVPPMKTQRFECCFWGALIKIILTQKIIWILKIKIWKNLHLEISEMKAAKIIKNRWNVITDIFLHQTIPIEQYFNTLEKAFIRSAIKEKKKGRRLPNQIMQNP